MKQILILILLLSVTVSGMAQAKKKSHNAQKTELTPKIDGKLDDLAWQNVAPADQFIQFEPYNGKVPSQKTEVKIIYDNTSIYIGAMMYDSNPDSIFTVLGPRDSGFGLNSDLFAIDVQPYNDGLSSSLFIISASGVQSDVRVTSNTEDDSWDAVWYSEVKVTDKGWTAEIRIPYAALRFPKKDEQVWGINFYRNLRRKDEWSSWNFVNNQINGFINQAGELHGIKNINPPLRLSVTPYVSAYAEHSGEEQKWGNSRKGGMDLKVGLNESFTLDMILIPDFKQVQADDQRLNLTQFEVRYSEKRAFFTEGTELFSKGGIFYSKRIGSRPRGYGNYDLNENEETKYEPSETPLLNAIKVSGRTNFGLGVGVFNAITQGTEAIIIDNVTEEERTVKTQSFTNYNLMVFDQKLRNNSYISFVNTNVSSLGLLANVTATDVKLMDKTETYSFFGRGAVNQIHTDDADTVALGHKYFLSFEKVSGNFLFEIEHSVESKNYNPNHMGYLRNPNEWIVDADIGYQFLEPFSIFRSLRFTADMGYDMLYEPRVYNQFDVGLNANASFKNFYSGGFFMGTIPFGQNDYYEARVDGRFFHQPQGSHIGGYMRSDSRKKISFSAMGFIWSSTHDVKQRMYSLHMGPDLRISDKFSVNYDLSLDSRNNSYGFVEASEDESDIWFGLRDVKEYTNTINLNMMFTDKVYFTFRARHYWSAAQYNEYLYLNTDGTVSPAPDYVGNADVSFNSFSTDAVFTWRFAPGSELLFVWKNNTSTWDQADEIMHKNYPDNFKYTLDSPFNNSLSFKLLYYLDYQSLRR